MFFAVLNPAGDSNTPAGLRIAPVGLCVIRHPSEDSHIQVPHRSHTAALGSRREKSLPPFYRRRKLRLRAGKVRHLLNHPSAPTKNPGALFPPLRSEVIGKRISCLQLTPQAGMWALGRGIAPSVEHSPAGWRQTEKLYEVNKNDTKTRTGDLRRGW